MQKKQQKVYFALQGKHSWDNIFVTKKYFFRNEHKKIFWTARFLLIQSSDGKARHF